MKALAIALFLSIATFTFGMAPPNSRPDTPPISLTQVIEIATTKAKEVDSSAYAGEAVFRYAFMSPVPNEFTRDRWEVVFYRPKGTITSTGFPDIVVAVTLDGKKARIIKK